MPCFTSKREFQKRRVTPRQSPVPNIAKKQVGKFYRPRNHETSFFKVVHDHFDEFERVYPERFQAKYGYWRPVIRSSINKFLTSKRSVVAAKPTAVILKKGLHVCAVLMQPV